MNASICASHSPAIKLPMTQLARKLRVTDYFSLGWGTMVGVGWLVVMDDWLLRGGPLGGILGFAIGGILLAPDRLRLRQAGDGHARRRGRDRLHRERFPATSQLLHRMDDDARLFHRLPVGSRGRWPHRRLYLSRARFDRVVSSGRQAGLPSAPGHRACAHGTGYGGELSRHPVERDVSKLEHVWHAGAFRVFVAIGVTRGSPANFPPLFTHTPFLSILLVLRSCLTT
jgi:hypothetical protein